MKKLTRNDIAKKAGVSPSTVSRALSDSKLLPQSTIDHVKKVAQELGYQPNILARRLATNRSCQIGVVVPLGFTHRGPFQTSYFSHILDSMVITAYRYDYSISIHPYELNDKNRLQKLKNLVHSRQVDGLVFIGLTQKSKIPAALVKEDIPFVLMGSNPSSKNMFSVNCSPEKGIAEMLTALKNKGYKRLIFAEGDMRFYDAILQKKILLKSIRNSGIELGEVYEGNYSRTSGYEIAKEVIKNKQPGDCVFLANDRMAIGFYRYCQEHAIAIPDEIGVIGSDEDEAATVLLPDLSTIHQPRTEMGQTAVELLMKIINKTKEGLQSLVIDEHFIEKKSI